MLSVDHSAVWWITTSPVGALTAGHRGVGEYIYRRGKSQAQGPSMGEVVPRAAAEWGQLYYLNYYVTPAVK